MPKPKDINELRDQLLDAFEMVKQDPRRASQVQEMTNTAGKVIGIIKLQLQYAISKAEEPDLPFLGKTSGKPIKIAAQKLIGAASHS